MDDKKYTMAELLAEFGNNFSVQDKYDNEPEVESAPEEQSVEPEQEKIEEPKEKDITIKCKKCENDFVWSVREQEFYKEKGFRRPAYCKECRKKTKVVNNFHKDI